ncbi:hypothetical protein CR162_21520 [Pseudoroseomonas rhizosphaerae]|uniref:Uncharacterized protein n=1 Tax=Teichococcus rhizosphaerae TaxID=1335062 RepID=A0A2C7A791_9PROT|nr:hypothetical protein [Pseudoroseomonas rhizosphaerae]PHK92894.1 hypothetical protein CR162_21520 [Pseudoroseomonas rhizosphaerae]
MSVSLTRVVGTALNLGNAIGRAVDGSSTGVTLAGVALEGFESPSSMPWGGEQRHARFDFPGGGRTVQALGWSEKDVQFQGTFFGPDAVSKARRLEAAAKRGAAEILTWSDFWRTVLIVGFEADYTTSGLLVPYRVSCVVIPTPEPVREPGFMEKLGNDVATGLGLTDITATLSTARAYLGKAKDIMDAAAPFIPSQAVRVTSALKAATSAVDGTKMVAEGKLGGFATLAAAGQGFSSMVSATGNKGKDASTAILQLRAAARAEAAAVAVLANIKRAENSVAKVVEEN